MIEFFSALAGFFATIFKEVLFFAVIIIGAIFYFRDGDRDDI